MAIEIVPKQELAIRPEPPPSPAPPTVAVDVDKIEAAQEAKAKGGKENRAKTPKQTRSLPLRGDLGGLGAEGVGPGVARRPPGAAGAAWPRR